VKWLKDLVLQYVMPPPLRLLRCKWVSLIMSCHEVSVDTVCKHQSRSFMEVCSSLEHITNIAWETETQQSKLVEP